jgi:hypothetical protein
MLTELPCPSLAVKSSFLRDRELYSLSSGCPDGERSLASPATPSSKPPLGSARAAADADDNAVAVAEQRILCDRAN